MISFSFLYGVRPRTASGMHRLSFLRLPPGSAGPAARLCVSIECPLREPKKYIFKHTARREIHLWLGAAAVEPRSVLEVREERDCESNNATDEFSKC